MLCQQFDALRTSGSRSDLVRFWNRQSYGQDNLTPSSLHSWTLVPNVLISPQPSEVESHCHSCFNTISVFHIYIYWTNEVNPVRSSGRRFCGQYPHCPKDLICRNELPFKLPPSIPSFHFLSLHISASTSTPMLSDVHQTYFQISYSLAPTDLSFK